MSSLGGTYRCFAFPAYEGASYSCSQQQAAGSPGEHPEKRDILEVQVNLPVAAGPECTQKSSSESRVAVGVSLICEPLVLLAACTFFQQHFFPVSGGCECLSELAEWTKQWKHIEQTCFKQDSEGSQAKLLEIRHAVQPLPLLLLSLYHLGVLGKSSGGRNILVCHQLFPVTCACFCLA